jgi:hypothetical protein
MIEKNDSRRVTSPALYHQNLINHSNRNNIKPNQGVEK